MHFTSWLRQVASCKGRGRRGRSRSGMWQASFSLISLVLHLLPGAANRATLDDIVQNDFVIIVNVAIIERKKKIKMGSC